MKIKELLFLTFILGFTSCKDSQKIDCCVFPFDAEVIVSATLYANAPQDAVTINSLEINENVLTINFGASGCDGATWEEKLIDSEEIIESNPAQRNLIFSLNNNEECDAYITKEISVDISSLKIEGESQIILNIINTNDEVLYEW